MFEKYLSYLFIQFCETKGYDIKIVDFSYLYLKEFIKWIKTNSALLDQYKEYLSFIGIDCCGENAFELGKGRLDSLKKHGAKVITQFGSTLKENYSRPVVSEGRVIVVNPFAAKELIEKIILTHNPYFGDAIAGWYKVHNLGLNDISIGMFGSLYDENAKEKIQLLERLSKKMTDDHTLDFDTDKGNYFASLNSRRKVKVKTRIK